MSDTNPKLLDLPEMEQVPTDAYPATKRVIGERNFAKRRQVEALFREILDWAGEHCGFGDTEAERRMTGLAHLVYLYTVEPQDAVLFAAEICEEHNYHGQCARLHILLDEMQSPYPHQSIETQTVNWWAE